MLGCNGPGNEGNLASDFENQELNAEAQAPKAEDAPKSEAPAKAPRRKPVEKPVEEGTKLPETPQPKEPELYASKRLAESKPDVPLGNLDAWVKARIATGDYTNDSEYIRALIRRDQDMSKVAIIDLGGEEPVCEYTYVELDGMAMGVARALSTRGFNRGDRIAILSANRAEYIAAYFGIMRAGFVAVPVNYRFPRTTIHTILEDCGAKLVFCDDASKNDVPHGLPHVLFGSEDADGFDEFIDPGQFQSVMPSPGEPAMFLYTSGSTGRPKGVILSHQSHLWVVKMRNRGRSISVTSGAFGFQGSPAAPEAPGHRHSNNPRRAQSLVICLPPAPAPANPGRPRGPARRRPAGRP